VGQERNCHRKFYLKIRIPTFKSMILKQIVAPERENIFTNNGYVSEVKIK